MARFGCDNIRVVLHKLSLHTPESFKRFLRPATQIIRSFGAALSDKAEIWTGKRDPLTPPARLLATAGFGTLSLEEHQRNGDWHVDEILVRLAGLQPNHRVLDVGSGIGQKARSLTRFLVSGSYEGIDISEIGVKWCQTSIASRYPNFQFREADLYNSVYRPEGKESAVHYDFPYDSAQFDFVIVFSVFTHMMPDEVENYLSEIWRMLKSGGVCVASFFVLGEDSSKAVERGWNVHPFPYAFDGYRLFMKEKPEAAIAYDEKLIREMYARQRLIIADPVLRGRWWWGDMHSQDYVIAAKQ
jgi:SAM-dependent methyltransferase